MRFHCLVTVFCSFFRLLSFLPKSRIAMCSTLVLSLSVSVPLAHRFNFSSTCLLGKRSHIWLKIYFSFSLLNDKVANHNEEKRIASPKEKPKQMTEYRFLRIQYAEYQLIPLDCCFAVSSRFLSVEIPTKISLKQLDGIEWLTFWVQRRLHNPVKRKWMEKILSADVLTRGAFRFANRSTYSHVPRIPSWVAFNEFIDCERWKGWNRWNHWDNWRQNKQITIENRQARTRAHEIS